MIYINNLLVILKYIFFNKKTCQLFKNSATSSGITPIIDCADDHFTVRLPEDSKEDILEKLEDYYDELMNVDRTLAEQLDDSEDNVHAAGITIQPRN